MGNPKQKWTAEEEEALRAGVAKHGTGKWKNIQKDPDFNPYLYSRSNIDLKDKWRNMSVSANGQGPREKSRTPKIKANPDAPIVASPVPLNVMAPAMAPASSALVVCEQPSDVVMDDSTKCVLDGKTASKYNAMIYEALSTLKNPNGSDTSTIVSFIEKYRALCTSERNGLAPRQTTCSSCTNSERHEAPPNFRRLLSSRLRRLVGQDKLEKVQNCYRIKTDALSSKSPNSNPNPIPEPKDVQPKQPQTDNVYRLGDTVEEAAVYAAEMIADAENKSFVAAEAVKEAERIARMAEETESLLQLAKEIYEKCSQGEIVMIS